MKFIHHHFGLGDHIICNGMIRSFHGQYGKLSLFCYNHNYDNVSYMYRDLQNLNLIGVDSDQSAMDFAVKNNLDYVQIGFNQLQNYMPMLTCDRAFYKIAGLDFSVRFTEFYFERNFDQEEKVLQELNPSGEKFIFVHDDPDRGFNIDLSRIDQKYKIIKNDKRFKVFDYLTLFEEAEEIHFMQSSMKELICSYRLKKPKLYSHKYVRKYPPEMNTVGLNRIIEID